MTSDQPVLLGYARVSTDDQNPRIQVDALVRAGVEESSVYYETVSGASLRRPMLEALIRDLRPGDTVVVWKFDRLSRSIADMFELVRLFRERGATFRSLTEQIDTSGPAGELFFHMLAAFAQFELSMIRERTRAGVERARREGRAPGRPSRFTDEQVREAKAKRQAGAPWKDAAASIGMSESALIKRIKRLSCNGGDSDQSA